MAPGFTANDAAASIEWYCDVLGFTVKERWEHEVQFRGAQITSGAVTINIGQDDWKLGRHRVKGQGSRMYIMTGPGIDQYAAAIKARGGSLTLPAPASGSQFFTQSPRVTVRLVNGDGVCWEALFPASATKKNTVDRFVASTP